MPCCLPVWLGLSTKNQSSLLDALSLGGMCKHTRAPVHKTMPKCHDKGRAGLRLRKQNGLSYSRKTSPKRQPSPQACSDISLLTVCLGGQLPLLVLPESALRCGRGRRLLRPGCGLPDSVVSKPPHTKGTAVGPRAQAGLTDCHTLKPQRKLSWARRAGDQSRRGTGG